MMDLEDLIGLGLVFGIIYILADTAAGIEDALGLSTPKSSAPPAQPVMQGTVFSPGVCPAGYIADSDGNCIQVTGAIHQ